MTFDLEFTYRQSWLGEYVLCPERARLKWFELVPDGPSDATAIGTGAHAGIEYIIRGGSHAEAIQYARDAFVMETHEPHYRWVQVKTEETAFRHIETALDGWLWKVEPLLGTPIWVEQEFKFHFVTLLLPDGRTVGINLSGTADFADEAGVWDWKTCKDPSKYTAGWGGEGWKLKRFGIQPTVYTLAGQHEGLWDLLSWGDAPWSFTYAAMTKASRSATLLPVERTATDVAWLKRLCINATKMLVSDLPEWPLNDQSALCSEQWCPAHSICKGADAPL